MPGRQQVARCALGFLRTRLGLPSMGRASRNPGMGPTMHLVPFPRDGADEPGARFGISVVDPLDEGL